MSNAQAQAFKRELSELVEQALANGVAPDEIIEAMNLKCDTLALDHPHVEHVDVEWAHQSTTDPDEMDRSNVRYGDYEPMGGA